MNTGTNKEVRSISPYRLEMGDDSVQLAFLQNVIWVAKGPYNQLAALPADLLHL